MMYNPHPNLTSVYRFIENYPVHFGIYSFIHKLFMKHYFVPNIAHVVGNKQTKVTVHIELKFW